MIAQYYSGLKLKELSQKNRIPVKLIAERLQVSKANVYDLFKRDNLRRDTVIKFYEALGLPKDGIDNSVELVESSNDKDFQVKYISQLENRVQEQTLELREKSEQIRELQATIKYLLGKSKANKLQAVA